MKEAKGRGVQVTKVSRRLLTSTDRNPNTLVDLPPLLWVVKGPRGGRYVAGMERERFVTEDDGNDFVMNLVSVVDRSARIYYVRPGSRLARMVDAGEAPPLP